MYSQLDLLCDDIESKDPDPHDTLTEKRNITQNGLDLKDEILRSAAKYNPERFTPTAASLLSEKELGIRVVTAVIFWKAEIKYGYKKLASGLAETELEVVARTVKCRTVNTKKKGD